MMTSAAVDKITWKMTVYDWGGLAGLPHTQMGPYLQSYVV